MQYRLSQTAACLSLIAAANCLPSQHEAMGKRSIEVRDGVTHTMVEHRATGATIDYVTNSGVCETTPGVNQYSGYVSVGTNMSMFFWFFESRNSPSTAPLAMWVNGGPGCSSMLGLFTENGPCTFNNAEGDTPVLNPYSWNEYANMLYVDQPIGTGFSFGSETVNTTFGTAEPVWTLLQAFFTNFPQYENRDFGIFTESYGGHFGPRFSEFFQAQNADIASGKIQGQTINLVALGINNGYYDEAIAATNFPRFSTNNSYYPLINNSIALEYVSQIESQCLPGLSTCAPFEDGHYDDCIAAEGPCAAVENNFSQFYLTNYSTHDIRQLAPGHFPPETYVTYLQDPTIMKKIGVNVIYSECSNDVANDIDNLDDGIRSYLPALSSVVESGVTTVIWAGDADSVCDWFAGFAAANAIEYQSQTAFNQKAVADYTVNGVTGGEFKTVGALSWLRVFGAGHGVPAYQPELALQVFKQTMMKTPLKST
ncbi:Alpha/Beta hydrolase protein [Trichoderma chlorosporum]